MSLVKLKD